MTWILTATGKHFDFADPQPDQIDILDIAQALGHECRFGGHTNYFYSVAQHSELVSRIVGPGYALEGLLHDAAEAYLKDIPMPLKQMLPDYKAVERRVDAAIRARFGLPTQCSDPVKHADLILLATERRDLMPPDSTPWALLHGIEPMANRIMAVQSGKAQGKFLRRWVELTQ